MPESHSEAIAWTTSQYDFGKWQMIANDFAPNLDLNVRCSNSPNGNTSFIYELETNPKRHFITSYWCASRCMRISYIQIPQKIKLIIKIDDTGTEKDYYIEPTVNCDTTVLAPMLKGFLDDLFGMSVYSVKASYGEIHIYRMSEAVSTISVKSSHAWFPFQGNNISDLKLRFYLNQIVKLPNLLNREALFNYIYQYGRNFKTMNNGSLFFTEHSLAGYLNRNHVFKSTLTLKCQFCDPVTRQRVKPAFCNNFSREITPYNNSNVNAYANGSIIYDYGQRIAISNSINTTVTFTQGSTTLTAETSKGAMTQYEFINELNRVFSLSNIPLQFEMRRNGYYAEGSTCTLTGNVLSLSDFRVMETSTRNGVTTFFFPY